MYSFVTGFSHRTLCSWDSSTWLCSAVVYLFSLLYGIPLYTNTLLFSYPICCWSTFWIVFSFWLCECCSLNTLTRVLVNKCCIFVGYILKSRIVRSYGVSLTLVKKSIKAICIFTSCGKWVANATHPHQHVVLSDFKSSHSVGEAVVSYHEFNLYFADN